MQQLLAAVQASQLAADAEMAGDGVECMLPLTDLTARITAQDHGDPVRGLSLACRVPTGAGQLALAPERGMGGAVAALREIEVDDTVVDDAWVIRGDAPALLVALLPALRALAHAAPTVTLDADSLRVTFALPIPHLELGTHVHQALALWERVASFRLSAA